MSRDRRAAVKQADIARAIKALEAAGYKIGAVKLGKDGFEVVPAIPVPGSVIRPSFDGKQRRVL